MWDTCLSEAAAIGALWLSPLPRLSQAPVALLFEQEQWLWVYDNCMVQGQWWRVYDNCTVPGLLLTL